MKKIFSLIAITAVAATMFTSCKADKPAVPETGKAKLSLTATPATVAVAAEGTFTVTSDINALEAIVVVVKSSDDKILTVDPASVTIAQGTKTITGKYKGVADGKATITISTKANASISVGSVEITVGTPPPASAEIEKMFTGKGEEEGKTYGYAYHEDPTDPRPEGQRDNLAYFTFSDLEEVGLVVYVGATKDTDKPMAMGVLKEKDLFLTSVAEGTTINFDAMVTSPDILYPTIYTPEYKDLATGTDVYIVLACGDANNTTTTYRAWAKINLGAAGDVSALTIIEAYVCLNDGEFKVGQKE